MARKQTFLAAVWSDVWKESYAKLSAERQAGCDETAMALINQTSSSGLRIKPIQPAKYYPEARINSGDRIVFRGTRCQALIRVMQGGRVVKGQAGH